MPPTKPQGKIFAEDHLAQRIELERTLRGWSYEGLAKRVTDAGCAISPSAIHKIEKANPRRRITVDEAIAYAEVFEIPVSDLLVPPKLAGKSEFVELWRKLANTEAESIAFGNEVRQRQTEFTETHELLLRRLGELAQLDPALKELVPDLIAELKAVDPTKRDRVVGAYLDALDYYADPTNRDESNG